MFGFKKFIIEEKNTHMEHLEELMFNDGVEGTRQAINFLRDLRDMLAGHKSTAVDTTVKWDGAPAIFIGIDPEDNKFFVAKKGLFNKTKPDMYKTRRDLLRLQGDLRSKFAVALQQFSKMGIKKGVVYQGDLMFTGNDIKKQTIDGQAYYTFHPNTIVYAVPVDSPIGRQIKAAKIGVVWHTTYTGRTIQGMTASFGKDITKNLRSNRSIWMTDATYHDVSGKATLTADETRTLTSHLSTAGTLFRQIPATALNAIRDNEELKQKIKTYNNTHVRAGEPFPQPKEHAKGLYNYINDWYQDEMDKKKTQKGKDTWSAKRDAVLRDVFAHAIELVKMFELMNELIQAKQIVVEKMQQASKMATFIKTSRGFKVTGEEGYVAIDKIGNAVKIVDRLEFSRANFSADVIKGWDK
jgi:hypothetical protein